LRTTHAVCHCRPCLLPGACAIAARRGYCHRGRRSAPLATVLPVTKHLSSAQQRDDTLSPQGGHRHEQTSLSVRLPTSRRGSLRVSGRQAQTLSMSLLCTDGPLTHRLHHACTTARPIQQCGRKVAAPQGCPPPPRLTPPRTRRPGAAPRGAAGCARGRPRPRRWRRAGRPPGRAPGAGPRQGLQPRRRARRRRLPRRQLARPPLRRPAGALRGRRAAAGAAGRGAGAGCAQRSCCRSRAPRAAARAAARAPARPAAAAATAPAGLRARSGASCALWCPLATADAGARPPRLAHGRAGARRYARRKRRAIAPAGSALLMCGSPSVCTPCMAHRASSAGRPAAHWWQRGRAARRAGGGGGRPGEVLQHGRRGGGLGRQAAQQRQRLLRQPQALRPRGCRAAVAAGVVGQLRRMQCRQHACARRGGRGVGTGAGAAAATARRGAVLGQARVLLAAAGGPGGTVSAASGAPQRVGIRFAACHRGRRRKRSPIQRI